MTPELALTILGIWIAGSAVIGTLFFHAAGRTEKLLRQNERRHAPDMAADKLGIGAGNLVHFDNGDI